MNELFKKLLVVITAIPFFFSGCATTPKVTEEIPWQQVKTQIPPNNSLLYVVRPPRYGGSANRYKIIINGTHIADMVTGTYFSYLVQSGDVNVSAEAKANILNFGLALAFMGKPELALTTIPGEIYFVNVGVGFSGGPTLTRVESPEGESLIKKSKKTKILHDQ